MAVIKYKHGWMVDCTPYGRYGPRVRKRGFKTQADAKRFEAVVSARAAQGEDYQPVKRDRRRLLDLVELWYQHHGHTLKSAKDRRRSLRKVATELGNPLATAFTSHTWAEYRAQRLTQVKPSTVNHEHAYLKAMFSELSRLDLWSHPNPLAQVRMVRVDETEMAYLDHAQIARLLGHLKRQPRRDCYLITLLCLSTGARWSEAQTLRGENVGKDRVTFVATKSGKTRTVPISPYLAGQLRHRCRIGRLFRDAYNPFRRAIKDLAITLPEGQLTHVLRHTFASHFMMNGGNILVLQRILGHQSITMTMRYAHFAPDHLEDAVKLNPVATCGNDHALDT